MKTRTNTNKQPSIKEMQVENELPEQSKSTKRPGVVAFYFVSFMIVYYLLCYGSCSPQLILFFFSPILVVVLVWEITGNTMTAMKTLLGMSALIFIMSVWWR